MNDAIRIPEQVVRGKRLGRHVNHDPRSLRYVVAPRAHAAQSVQWQRVTPVLDQGNLGSCTGNATVGALGTHPYIDTIPSGITLDEAEGVRVYELATRLDSYPGNYPPDDTGSDGLSAAKAAQQSGLIAGYRHCTSVDAVITALQSGPVITGVNWYDSFDQPDAAGRVTIAPGAQVRGGHEFEVYGVDLSANVILAVNSWGTNWGQGGRFLIPLADYERLLREQGDATAFVPITQPAPTPSPVTPPSVDQAFITLMEPWAQSPHVWHLATVADRAYADWKKAHGYA